MELVNSILGLLNTSAVGVVVVILITDVVIDAANAHKDVEINIMLFDLLFLPKVKAHFPILPICH